MGGFAGPAQAAGRPQDSFRKQALALW